MTIDALVAKWEAPIGEWAVRKGWLKQEIDPANPDKMRNIPRDMLHLLMLMVTELCELDEAIRNEDLDNAREEAADFAIRAIQMRYEFGLAYQGGLTIDSVDSVLLQLSDFDGHPYEFACHAAEAWRNKSLSDAEREKEVWDELTLAIVQIADNAAPEDVGSGDALLEWLDEAIAEKMAANEKRPYMHGKLA